jgi:hypothetical protein
MKEKLIEFWKKHETKAVLLAGFLLVAFISFQGGYLKGRELKDSPLVIEKPVLCQTSTETVSSDQSKPAMELNTQANKNVGAVEKQNCAYVGSKNSNKYHLPTCRYAQNIKSENLVCFISKEDAEKRGYQPDSNCVK